MTDKFITTAFPYQCKGAESSLSECKITSSVCNAFNNNSADIVAISCQVIS